MICYISPAKTFAKKTKAYTLSTPTFAEESLPIIERALTMSPEDYARDFKLSPSKVKEARQHWHAFVEGEIPASACLALYSGMVFKKINSADFTPEDWAYANEHLRICSFVYGWLRPLDAIKPYRMEGTVRLEGGERVFDYWRDKVTPLVISEVQQSGGVLINLASDEMQQLMHFGEIKKSVRVINLYFELRQADGSLKTIVIYCKMARGAMAREIIKQRIEDPEQLKLLTPEGFRYDETLSSENDWHYILES